MLINQDIVFRHAQDAAFFWARRTEALSDNSVDHGRRTDLDDRVDANLDGLYIAEDAGMRIATELRVSYPEHGEIFCCAVLAAYAQPEEQFERLWADVADVSSRAPFVSALGWHQYAHVRSLLSRLVESGDAALVVLGMSGYCAHRKPPERRLDHLIGHSDAEISARGVKLAGVLGQVGLVGDLRSLLGGAVGRQAAFALSLLGADYPEVRAHLRAALTEDRDSLTSACRLVNLHPVRAQEEIRELIRQGSALAAIHAIWALGDCSHVPRLINWMEDERCAATARCAFAAMTGLDDVAGIERVGVEELENVQAGEGAAPSAPVSSSEAAAAWHANQERFEANTRYIAGKPVGSLRGVYTSVHCAALEELVRTGRPLERSVAASCLASISPTRHLPEVRAFASSGHELPGISSDALAGGGAGLAR